VYRATLLLFVLALAAVPAAGATVNVRTEAQLQAAVAAAGPGTEIAIAPGRYVLTRRLTIGPGQSGTATAPVVLRPQGDPGSVVLDGNGNEEPV